MTTSKDFTKALAQISQLPEAQPVATEVTIQPIVYRVKGEKKIVPGADPEKSFLQNFKAIPFSSIQEHQKKCVEAVNKTRILLQSMSKIDRKTVLKTRFSSKK